VGYLEDQDGCLVAFRGSANKMNWIRDFEFWGEPAAFDDCDNCSVHHGFYYTWKYVRDNVLDALEEVGCGPQSSRQQNLVYVTGHSFGAALVEIAMFSMDQRGFNVAKAYSFEAPRVGNEAFAHAFNERFGRKFPVYRITHAQDPAVHVPPVNFGYRHPQTEVFYDSSGKYKICENEEDPVCAGQYSNIPLMLAMHSDDHCGTSLVPNGNICDPVGCHTTTTTTTTIGLDGGDDDTRMAATTTLAKSSQANASNHPKVSSSSQVII
jgi:hypothetical protein